MMINEQEIPVQFRHLFKEFKVILSPEAFEIWCKNVRDNEKNPMPENYLQSKKPAVKDLLTQAREAVSGYSENNGARKAVEILADAIEGK
jgi:hypothetical protein